MPRVRVKSIGFQIEVDIYGEWSAKGEEILILNPLPYFETLNRNQMNYHIKILLLIRFLVS